MARLAAIRHLAFVALAIVGACATAEGSDDTTSPTRTLATTSDGVPQGAPALPSTTLAPSTTTTQVLAPAPELPRFELHEYGTLIDAVVPVDTAIPAWVSPITGHLEADERIRSLAEGRGYRLRPVTQVRLVAEAGVLVHPDVAVDLAALLADAHERGLVLEVRSGYRSVARQREIFLRELDEESVRLRGRQIAPDEIAAGDADDVVGAVLAYHSVPGYSRHHSGFTVDFEAGGGVAGFEGSPAEESLRAEGFATALRHGFVPSYPRGGRAQGPEPEPWEFVHVGVGTVRCAALHIPMRDLDAARSCPLIAE